MDLTDALPDHDDPDAVFEAYAAWTADRGLTLYPAQEEAVLALLTGSNVILATPTGSGKSLVAVAAHAAAMARGERSWYTAPIKALVSEKFFALCEIFGAGQVGMMTGDAVVNAEAPIICATAEVLANTALRERDTADIATVVMDEFHFYAEPDRGWAWQVPLLLMPQCQFLLMSATLGDTSFFERDLRERTGRDTVLVAGAGRPVPLEFDWLLTPVHQSIEVLLRQDRAPVYVVHFTQAEAVERAQALMSVNVCSPAEKAAIKAMIGGFRFGKGFGAVLKRLVLHGIGVHHAGMLPKYRRLVETLAQAGLLKVICGTDTLGVGINVPIRTVLFTSLVKYDGRKQRLLRAREFHQIAGRAGRAGFDTRGYVAVEAPDHVIANAAALAKAGDDPKARRKAIKKKPPEGQLTYAETGFDKLVASPPEPLRSRMRVTHAMLLQVFDRLDGQGETLRTLLAGNHGDQAAQDRLTERAARIIDSLLRAEVIEAVPGVPGYAVPAEVLARLTPGPPPDPVERAPHEATGEPGSSVDDASGGQGDRRADASLRDAPADLAYSSVSPEQSSGGDAHQAAQEDRAESEPLDVAALLGQAYAVTDDLQEGFALNQPLSAFALAALELLDRHSPAYALDVVSVIEATLEDPRQVLMAQQAEARAEAVAEFKADGMDYEERREAILDVSWPRPLADELEAALAAYRRGHPWVSPGDLSPKAVVRDLFERGMTFGEFVAHYKLARAEGIVLRYLSDAYRALRATVPLWAVTDEVDEIIDWLGEVVRQTDSSLLDEWEALTHPADDAPTEIRAETPRALSANPRVLRTMARQAIFRRVELIALERWAELAALDPGLKEHEWAAAGDAYYAEYADLGTGPDARGPALFSVAQVPAAGDEPAHWLLTQILDDPEGDRDWRLTAYLDLAATDDAGEPVLRTLALAPTG